MADVPAEPRSWTLPPWTCSVVPTLGFDLLYAFVIIVRLGRRRPSSGSTSPRIRRAEWVARQITEAFPWDKAPHYPSYPAIATGSMAASSRADCAGAWASAAAVSRPVQANRCGSVHAPSWADFTTTTPAFKLSVHTTLSSAVKSPFVSQLKKWPLSRLKP